MTIPDSMVKDNKLRNVHYAKSLKKPILLIH